MPIRPAGAGGDAGEGPLALRGTGLPRRQPWRQGGISDIVSVGWGRSFPWNHFFPRPVGPGETSFAAYEVS